MSIFGDDRFVQRASDPGQRDKLIARLSLARMLSMICFFLNLVIVVLSLTAGTGGASAVLALAASVMAAMALYADITIKVLKLYEQLESQTRAKGPAR